MDTSRHLLATPTALLSAQSAPVAPPSVTSSSSATNATPNVKSENSTVTSSPSSMNAIFENPNKGNLKLVTSFLTSVIGLLKILQVALGIVIIGLTGHVALHDRTTGQHFFLLIVIMMLLLTTSLLIIFLLNLDAVFHTIPFAFLDLVYSVMCALFYLIASILESVFVCEELVVNSISHKCYPPYVAATAFSFINTLLYASSVYARFLWYKKLILGFTALGSAGSPPTSPEHQTIMTSTLTSPRDTISIMKTRDGTSPSGSSGHGVVTGGGAHLNYNTNNNTQLSVMNDSIQNGTRATLA